jgi:NAD(P)-dependent dehydrogenase (short-subunit alcohol dehydrogenase family)
MSDFEGKHVVVTGATGGLGVAVVQLLLERGATCHLPMIEKEVPKLSWSGHARAHAHIGQHFDDELQVTAFYEQLPSLWASIHLVGGFSASPITETSLADFQKMLSINAVTTFLCSREAVRTLRRSGGGRIVNVVARPAITPVGGGTTIATVLLHQGVFKDSYPDYPHETAADAPA